MVNYSHYHENVCQRLHKGIFRKNSVRTFNMSNYMYFDIELSPFTKGMSVFGGIFVERRTLLNKSSAKPFLHSSAIHRTVHSMCISVTNIENCFNIDERISCSTEKKKIFISVFPTVAKQSLFHLEQVYSSVLIEERSSRKIHDPRFKKKPT